MPKFEVHEISRSDDILQWDKLVAQSTHGTIFHTSGWLDICARSLGKKVKIFGCFQDAQLVGGCSLFLEKKFGIIPHAMSTCPMTPYGGFVLGIYPSMSARKQESFSRKIVESIIKEIKKEHFFSVHILNSPEFLDVRPFTMNGWRSSVLYAYYINLEDNLNSHSDHTLRNNITKAKKNEIVIEYFNNITQYYDIFSKTFARKNEKIPASMFLFSELYKFIKDRKCGEMMAAKTPDDEIAAARIMVWDNRMVYGWTSASDPQYYNTGASSLLWFETLKFLKEEGKTKMNLMMANIPKLSEFAIHLNPKLIPHYQVQTWIFDDTIIRLKNAHKRIKIPSI